jgi:hypothetical protein
MEPPQHAEASIARRPRRPSITGPEEFLTIGSDALSGVFGKDRHEVQLMMVRSTLLVACVLVSGCGGQSPETAKPASGTTAAPAAPALSLTPLALPATVGTEPQLTVSTKGTIFSWVEQNGSTATLKFAERTGANWSAVQTVASGKDWFVTDADLPTVQRLANGTLVAAWYRSTDVQAEAYDTWLAHSTDEGKSWSTPFKPYSDKTKTQHGFVSMFDQPGGGLGLVWLDAREWELNQDAPDGGSVMLRSASFDPSWKQTSDQVANLRVCDCCQTSVATTTDGVVVAFRDRTDKEIRDIHVTRLEGGKWTAPQPVHQDNWEIDSCPVNGPAISARGRTVAVAWFTAVGGQGHSYVAFSQDASRTFGDPVRLDEQQSTGRVDVELLDDGGAVASWVEFANQQAQLRARRISAAGQASAPLAVQATAEGRAGGFPRMVRQGDELLFVWSESAGGEHAEHGGSQMKAAVARLR